MHLARDMWEEEEALRNNFAFLYLSVLAKPRMWFSLVHIELAYFPLFSQINTAKEGLGDT